MQPFTLLARALLAYSVHEHQEGHARRIDVWVQPVRNEPVSAPSGTRITLATAPGLADVDPAALLVQIDLWRASHPALAITLH